MMFLVYLAMLLEPMAVLATSVTQFQNKLAGFDRVLDLMAEPREMADSPGNRRSSKSRSRRADHASRSGLRLSRHRAVWSSATSIWRSSRARRSHWSAGAGRARRRSAT